MPGIRLIGNVTIAVVLLYGGYLAYHGADHRRRARGVPALPAPVLRADAWRSRQFYNTFQSASAALEKLSGVLEEEPGVPEPTAPGRAAATRAATCASTTSGSSYVEGRPVLPDLDLTVPAGQTVALVGTTGAGKTTIAKLATRFYDPIDGAVTLDGVDLRALDVDRPAPRRR